MNPANVSSKWGRLLVAALLALFVMASSGLLSAGVAYAEGSRDLYPSGAAGFRANLEWRTAFYGPNWWGLRRSFLQVYAEAGEVILVGSSGVGVGAADILLYSSDQVTGPIGDETVTGAPDFSCEAQRAATGDPDQGRITSRAQELAGPDTVPGGGVPGGYVPCYYDVPVGGSAGNMYYVAFLGPAGNSNVGCAWTTGCTGETDLASPQNFDASQETSVSAWDVTVRSSLTSSVDITGRLFAHYLALNTGSTSRPMFSTFYVLSTDAYIYEVNLRELDPYGTVVYYNDVGFLDSDGATPLLRDVLADPAVPGQDQNWLHALLGDVYFPFPTHHIFFNEPSAEARRALNATDGWDGVNPIIPHINSFVFEGVLGGNDTLPGAGGTFVLDVNVEGSYLLVISRDGVDFDPTNPANRTLIGVGSVGPQQITWDGLDNAGAPFPVGSYEAWIQLRPGEVHFPLLDVENSMDGGPQYELINPPAGCPPDPPFAAGCFTGFYDDRGYTTIGGTVVGTPGAPLPGINPPPVPNSDPSRGFDTRSSDRAFGDGSEAGFGDKKGLDLWTFYPAEANTTLDILQQPVLRISKDHDSPCYEPGEGHIVNYTIHYANEGTGPALDATVTDTLPEATTFVSCIGAACNEISPGSGVVVYSLGTVDAGAGGSLGLTVRVDDDAKGDLTNRVRFAAPNVPAVETPNVLPCCPSPGTTPTPWATWTPIPTPTPWATWTPIPPLPVVLLPETGDSPASSPVCWLWLPLLLLGLPAACVIRCRRG